MDKFEELEQKMFDNNILLLENDFSKTSFKAVIIKQNNTYGIFVDNSLKSVDKIYYIEHELGHYYTSSFYTFDTSTKKVSRQEIKAINYVCKNMLPLDQIKELFIKGYQIYEIAEVLNLSELSIKDAIDYMYRKKIISY